MKSIHTREEYQAQNDLKTWLRLCNWTAQGAFKTTMTFKFDNIILSAVRIIFVSFLALVQIFLPLKSWLNIGKIKKA